MKRLVISSVVSTCMLANSLALANSTKQVVTQTKGAYQLIDESRQILWSKAYRIDKELVSYTDTKTQRHYYNETTSNTNSGDSSSATSRVIGSLAGGILGGGFAYLSGRALGAAGWLLPTLTGAGSAAGALMGGGSSGRSNQTSSTNSSGMHEITETQSRTYQIHEKANTWGIIAMDTVGYEKARAEILNSTLAQNSCVIQGMAFLDALKNYRVLNLEELNALGSAVEALQVLRTQEAILLDKGRGSQEKLNRIDEFAQQRIGVVRINWQEYLSASGNCALPNGDANQIAKVEKQLMDRFSASSSMMPLNSMNLITNITFKNAPYKKMEKAQKEALNPVAARMMVNQVLTLSALQELGYLTFLTTQNKLGVGAQAQTEMKIEKVPGAQTILTAAQETEKVDKFKGYSKSVMISAGVTYLSGFMAGIVAVTEELSGDRKSTRALSVVAGNSLAVGVALGIGAAWTDKYSEKVVKNNRDQMAHFSQELIKEKAFNDLLNRDISITEQVYQLNDNKSYQSKRGELIDKFKSAVAFELLNSMIENPNAKVHTSQRSFVGHLMQAHIGLISEKEYFEKQVILDFMNSKKINLAEVDRAQILTRQAEGLLEVVKAVIAENTTAEVERTKLKSIQTNLERELAGLKYLN